MSMYMGLMLDRSTTHNFSLLAQENDNFVVNDTLRYEHGLPQRTCTHIYKYMHILIECTKMRGWRGGGTFEYFCPRVSHNTTGPNA